MKKLLVVGDDKIGRRLIARLKENVSFRIILDKSSNIRRVFRLYRRGSLDLFCLFNMAIAEFFRKDRNVNISEYVKNNDDLLNLIYRYKVDQVYLFRAGLIINKKVLASGAVVLNIHCASIPDYGGLGAIARALQDGAYNQFATLHRVTDAIDGGEVIAIEPYKLDPMLNYRKNEDIAYEAGIHLLLRQLQNDSLRH
mgnify:CR=1 FL=1